VDRCRGIGAIAKRQGIGAGIIESHDGAIFLHEEEAKEGKSSFEM
jgi:hypothetical protein